MGVSGLTTPVSGCPSAPVGCGMSRGASTVDSAEIEWGIRENTALVPSYSEALLMDVSNSRRTSSRRPSSTTSGPRPLYYPSPLAETCPSDPFQGRPAAVEPPSYEEALAFPALTRLRRSLTDRGDICNRFGRRRSSEAHIIRAPHRPRTLITMETSL